MVRRIANAPGPLVAEAATARKRKAAQEAQAQAARACVASGVSSAAARPPAGTAAIAKWPSTLRRIAATAPASARAERESAERLRWVSKAGEVVVEAGLPLAQHAAGSAEPARVLAVVAQGRRAKTIRKRVRDWTRASRFFTYAHAVAWPSSLDMVLDYMGTLHEAGSKSAAFDFMGALMFFERGGGVRREDSYSENPTVRAAIAESTSRVPESRLRARRTAQRLPVAIAAALELQVMNADLPVYQRMFAWWKAVQVWGCLRFDDRRGMVPRELSVTGRGLEGTLVRTKTSGSGKSRETLPVFVSACCFFAAPRWLLTGWELWKCVDPSRDFFLVLPGHTLNDIRISEATYADSVAMTRALFARLPDASGESPLLDASLVNFWTEHSARATLPSWCACFHQFPSSWLDLLGRWGTGRSATYIRTQQQRVKKMQDTVSSTVRVQLSGAALSEDSLFDSLAKWAQTAHVEKAQVDNTIVALMGFVPSLAVH